MLLPPDLRDWVSEDDPVHFVLEVMEQWSISSFQVNERGTGSAQYPPSMMLALLVYCYSMGIFSSRKIEQATYRDIGVRYLTGDTHPDHDTICAFRRNNKAAIADCFSQTIVYAKEVGLAKVGIVSVDSTLIKANASKSRNITHERAVAIEEHLRGVIEELLEKAEQADQAEVDERLPEALVGPERLREQVTKARERIEKRAREHAELMKQTPVKERRGRNSKRHPSGKPAPNDRDNLTDPDSRIMRKNQHNSFEQSYNAQIVVDAEGSQLILGTRISQSSNDGCELAADIDAIPAEAGVPHTALADTGFASEPEVTQLEARGMDIYVSVHASTHSPNQLMQPRNKPLSKKAQSPFGQRMRDKLATPEGHDLYKRRKQTVEPVFGIIKNVLGFTQFHLRGLQNVELEWSLIALAYNMKRLWNLQHASTPA